MKYLVINGPNMNLLGTREPDLYGHESLDTLMSTLTTWARGVQVEIQWIQSNHEGELIDAIQQAASAYDGIIINPAGYGHTSVALRDALLASSLPSVEVHLTNLAKREDFRSRTLTAGAALGQISGFGPTVYSLAVIALNEHLEN